MADSRNAMPTEKKKDERSPEKIIGAPTYPKRAVTYWVELFAGQNFEIHSAPPCLARPYPLIPGIFGKKFSVTTRIR